MLVIKKTICDKSFLNSYWKTFVVYGILSLTADRLLEKKGIRCFSSNLWSEVRDSLIFNGDIFITILQFRWDEIVLWLICWQILEVLYF